MFAVNLCRNVWVLRSTKVGRHFEISRKLCSLLALESCAKGAEHHNKQKTTVHACKKLVMFAVNLCRKFCVVQKLEFWQKTTVVVLGSTKVGRHWIFTEIMCIIGSRKLCKGCTTSPQAHNNSTSL